MLTTIDKGMTSLSPMVFHQTCICRTTVCDKESQCSFTPVIGVFTQRFPYDLGAIRSWWFKIPS